jgi:hypothetical protein
MATPTKLDTQDLQFDGKYDPEKMRRMMAQLNAVTRFNQKLIALLRAGTVGQVLTKRTHIDFDGEWSDGGGGDCCIDLEEGQVAMGGPGGTTVPLNFGDGLAIVGDELINTGVAGPTGPTGPEGPEGPQGDPGEIPTLVEGFLIDIDATDPLNIEIAVDETALDALLAFSGARVYRSVGAGNQSIPNSTFTSVEFDTESYDTDAYWDAGDPSRLTVPTDGRYRFTANILSIAGAPVSRELYLLLNGDTGTRYALDTRQNIVEAMFVQATLDLVAGDYAEVSAFFAATENITPISQLVSFEVQRVAEL